MNLLEAQTQLGIKDFRDPQAKIIQNIIQNKKTLALLPTGYGKSICYQLPGLVKAGYTMVISPLIALMDDQVFHLKQKNISAIALHSSNNISHQTFLANLAQNKYKFVYLSPEKLILSHLNSVFTNQPPAIIAIDEAHCFSLWGNDFRPIYQQLPKFIKQFKTLPAIALFTATASGQVINDLINNFELSATNIFVGDFFRKNLFITHKKFQLRSQRFLYLCYLIFHKYKNKNGLIYCLTRKEVENIYHSIKKLDFLKQLSISFFHAGLSKDKKQKIIDKFVKNKIKVLVTTNAFGMGVDKKDLEFVIHQQVPDRLENYVQEIGRAGRGGQLSFCELLIHDFDFEIQKNLNKNNSNNHDMLNFINSHKCQQQKILNFFGQATPNYFNCHSCNHCSPACEIVTKQLITNYDLTTDTFINQQKYLFNYIKQPQFYQKYISVGTGQMKIC